MLEKQHETFLFVGKVTLFWVVLSNMFLFRPEIWGRFPFWRAYFSKGLKPPTIFFFGVPLVSRDTEMMATSFVVPVGEVLLERCGIMSRNFPEKKHGWKNPVLKKGNSKTYMYIYILYVYIYLYIYIHYYMFIYIYIYSMFIYVWWDNYICYIIYDIEFVFGVSSLLISKKGVPISTQHSYDHHLWWPGGG